MKILITSDLFLTTTNGVVTSIKNLRSELLNMGHEVKILSLANSRKSYKDGEDESFVGTTSLGWIYPGTRMPISYRNKIIKEIIEWKPDVIHSQCEVFSFFFALNVSKRTGAPIVHTYHTMYEDYAGYVFILKSIGKAIIRKATKNRLEKADAVIVPTEKVKAKLQGEQGVRGEFFVIPSGIDLERHKIPLLSEERKAMRNSLGVENDDIALINLGRLADEKNIDELLDYFKKARERCDKLKFIIVGGGPAKESLEAHAGALGIDEFVKFVGMVPPEEVGKYYKLGDIFVSASTSETQGLTYIEAMANRLPLICRYDACLEGVLENAENGFVYTTEEEFLAAIERLASDEKCRAQLAECGEMKSREYDKAIFARRVEQVYERAIAQKSAEEKIKVGKA